jgi:hypothetical protein
VLSAAGSTLICTVAVSRRAAHLNAGCVMTGAWVRVGTVAGHGCGDAGDRGGGHRRSSLRVGSDGPPHVRKDPCVLVDGPYVVVSAATRGCGSQRRRRRDSGRHPRDPHDRVPARGLPERRLPAGRLPGTDPPHCRCAPHSDSALAPGTKYTPTLALQYTWDSRTDEQRRWLRHTLEISGVDISKFVTTRVATTEPGPPSPR